MLRKIDAKNILKIYGNTSKTIAIDEKMLLKKYIAMLFSCCNFVLKLLLHGSMVTGASATPKFYKIIAIDSIATNKDPKAIYFTCCYKQSMV